MTALRRIIFVHAIWQARSSFHHTRNSDVRLGCTTESLATSWRKGGGIVREKHLNDSDNGAVWPFWDTSRPCIATREWRWTWRFFIFQPLHLFTSTPLSSPGREKQWNRGMVNGKWQKFRVLHSHLPQKKIIFKQPNDHHTFTRAVAVLSWPMCVSYVFGPAQHVWVVFAYGSR